MTKKKSAKKIVVKPKPQTNLPPCQKGFIRDSKGDCIEDPG